MNDEVAAALSANASSMPYYAVYELASDATPLQTDDFDGLELVHRVQTELSSEKLVTYWRNRDYWSAQDAKLRRMLTASGPTLAGFAYDQATIPKPFWRRLQLHTWILGLAALLGALDAIGNHYEWLFSRPFLSLMAKEPLDPGPVAGRSFATRVLVSNTTRIEHRALHLSAMLTPLDSTGKSTPLAVTPTTLASLSPGSAVEFELAGEAPTAGHYQIKTVADSKAGWLAGEGSFPLIRPLRIWPSTPSVNWSLKRQSAGFARIDAVLSLGPESRHGVDCQIFLIPHHSVGKPILDFFDATEVHWIVDDNTPGEERESLSWHGPAKARGETIFSCAVPMTSQMDLATLNKAISISCSNSEGGPQ